MSHKYKVTLWTILPILLLLAAVVVIRIGNHTEPLSPKEILAKKQWTQEELAFALARNFKHQAGREGRNEVLEHLKNQLNAFSPDDQEKIKFMAITQTIDDSIRQYRALKSDEKSKLVEALLQRAEKNNEKIARLNSAQRQEIRNRFTSKAGQSTSRAVQNAMINKLTPEERHDFAPIEKMWLSTIEKL